MLNDVKRVGKDGSLKHRLKIIRWDLRRTAAAFRWGAGELASAPTVFGNAMPKSGSHLITQVLLGLPKIGPFVNPGFPPVNRTEDNRPLTEAGIIANLNRMKPGDIGYGYLQAKETFVKALTRAGMASIFVSRDPRDMIVSHVFYATQIYPQHGMHRYYTEELDSMEERINAAIVGVTQEGSELSSVKERYAGYSGWYAEPGVLCLRFEDLILDQEHTFNAILDYLEGRGFHSGVDRQTAVESMAAAVAPQKSGTFRRGIPGTWREYFTAENIRQFKLVTGDLLVQLGYESDDQW